MKPIEKDAILYAGYNGLKKHFKKILKDLNACNDVNKIHAFYCQNILEEKYIFARIWKNIASEVIKQGEV